ncbi:MAG TPA: hypothetical protein PKA27_04310 [Fimbriimonadaceae bacterium]|nr:hypothetical protein [Fimbriimonadaceae bacterium]
MRRLLLLGLVALIAGCGSGSDLYPLRVGAKWDYQVRTALARSVSAFKVTGRAPIAGEYGYVIESDMGKSILVWKSGQLLASRLGGTRFSPPIPILVEDEIKNGITTKTSIEFGGTKEDGVAILTQASDKLTIEGKESSVIRATVILQTPSREVRTISTYAPGKGLIQQQQLTDGRFDLSLDRLDQ